jgi:hypothetical protein
MTLPQSHLPSPCHRTLTANSADSCISVRFLSAHSMAPPSSLLPPMLSVLDAPAMWLHAMRMGMGLVSLTGARAIASVGVNISTSEALALAAALCVAQASSLAALWDGTVVGEAARYLLGPRRGAAAADRSDVLRATSDAFSNPTVVHAATVFAGIGAALALVVMALTAGVTGGKTTKSTPAWERGLRLAAATLLAVCTAGAATVVGVDVWQAQQASQESGRFLSLALADLRLVVLPVLEAAGTCATIVLAGAWAKAAADAGEARYHALRKKGEGDAGGDNDADHDADGSGDGDAAGAASSAGAVLGKAGGSKRKKDDEVGSKLLARDETKEIQQMRLGYAWSRFMLVLVSSVLAGSKICFVLMRLSSPRLLAPKHSALAGPEPLLAPLASGVPPLTASLPVLVALTVGLVCARLLTPSRSTSSSAAVSVFVSALVGAAVTFLASVAAHDGAQAIEALTIPHKALIYKAFGLAIADAPVTWLAVVRWACLALQSATILLCFASGGGSGMIAHGVLIQGALVFHRILQF